MAQKMDIFKKILANGLTVLVRPTHHVPKASVQLWYNVGSKDEKDGEKGIAHLIEHMIFKGTKRLSESDINLITHKLSGYCNAFTSHDYTGYLFDFPSQNWKAALPIMADCMRNCTFKEDLLASELKAVIQELKMYKDYYDSALVEDMITAIFPDHPYHYPIIGYKQDLWSLNRDALVNFYEKHYVPNNATLVVVGDVEPEEVFKEAEHYFAGIEADPSYKKEEYYLNKDLSSKTITMYRDIKQPSVMLACVVPGAKEKVDYVLDVLSWVLGSGNGSRLHKKLVDELQLVTEVETFTYDLFDHGLFFVHFQPKNIEDAPRIIQLIQDEIADLSNKGATEKELQRAVKKTKAQYLSLLENNQKQAYVIGKCFLATDDENYLFNYMDYPREQLASDLKQLVQDYLSPSVMHKGFLLPLTQEDRGAWQKLQERSDEEDQRILGRKVRETQVEPGVESEKVVPGERKSFTFPAPQELVLDNGLKVLFYHNPNVPKVDVILDMKAKYYHDPENLQGLSTFVSDMLLEGTKQFSAEELAQEVESHGMSLTTSPGYVFMSMLSADVARGFELLKDVLANSTMKKENVEKTRERIRADIKNYWDQPTEFIGQLAREQAYKDHPYRKRSLGDLETIDRITRDDIEQFYRSHVSPQEAVLSIVGDLSAVDLPVLVKQVLGSWEGPKVEDLNYPTLHELQKNEVVYPMTRDQIVLAFVGRSIDRKHPDYDKILLFDQIFSGGALGSMSSRLFQLREQSGLFYTIGGSLLAHADKQPGMIYIKTIVSQDRLAEAEKVILKTIDETINTVTEHELEEARNAVINSAVDNFDSNKRMARTFLFMDKYGLTNGYFDDRAEKLANISLDEIKTAVKKILSSDKLVTIKVGRVDQS